MKKINKWVARDGSEWKTEESAVNHEIFLDKIEMVESIIPKKPDTTNFTNGHGYIQHSKDSIKKARNMLVELADEYVGSFMSTYDLKSYAFGRYLNDGNYNLYDLYNRIVSCIDDNTWREYGQTYFANNPNEAEQVCVNGE
jgi:hypothetical protein